MIPHSLALVLVSCLAALLPGCGRRAADVPANKAAATVAAVALVERRPFALTYRTSGTVRGVSTATLTGKTMGHVRTVHVRPGDVVRAGQLLAELEAGDVRAGVAGAEAALSSARASKVEAESGLEAAHVGAKLARTSHARAAALFADRVIARAQYDDEEARLQSAAAEEQMARARVESVESGIARAKAALAETRAVLGYTKILAPFAGRVLERYVDPGALATPGTALFVVADDTRLRVEASVEESRIPGLALGDTATIEVESVPAPLLGKVSEIVPNVDVTSRAFLVKIDLPENTRTLRAGTFARVNFHVGTEQRLVVPSSAINRYGALDRVFVLENGVARLRMITCGESQGPWTSVLSGVSEGDRLIRAPAVALRDGSRIEPSP
ncbi:MAG TPA: efflux RND transporter periplasmic adaptor subunit [Polyangiaceae bacterium]